MSKVWIYFLLVFGAVLLVIVGYRIGFIDIFFSRDGVTPKGNPSDPAVTYAALATSIVSLITAVIGLVKTSIEARKTSAIDPKQ